MLYPLTLGKILAMDSISCGDRRRYYKDARAYCPSKQRNVTVDSFEDLL
jgi:hypothetical protein